MSPITLPLSQSKLPLSQSKLLFPSFTGVSLSSVSASSNKHSSISIPYNASHFNFPRLASTSGSLRAPSAASTTTITTSVVDGTEDDHSDLGGGATAFVIHSRKRIGLLQVIIRVFKVLGLIVEKATVEYEGDYFTKTFYVTDSSGNRIEDAESLDKIKKVLMQAIESGERGAAEVKTGSTGRGIVVRRPGLRLGENRAKVERMFGLMDRFLKNDPATLQNDIVNHVEYTVARSRFSFDDFEAYQVTATATGQLHYLLLELVFIYVANLFSFILNLGGNVSVIFCP